MTGIFRKPTPDDINFLIENIREMDAKEIFYMSGGTVAQCLNDTVGILDNSTVWEVEGKVVCIFGTTPCYEEDHYIVWLLATNYFDEYKNIFKRICKKAFKETVKGKKHVYNYVYYGHTKAIEWIKWLGCKVYEPVPIGINNEMFCKFEVINNV